MPSVPIVRVPSRTPSTAEKLSPSAVLSVSVTSASMTSITTCGAGMSRVIMQTAKLGEIRRRAREDDTVADGIRQEPTAQECAAIPHRRRISRAAAASTIGAVPGTPTGG